MTPEQRVLRARLAAHARWARASDRVAATAPARRARAEQFEHEVDPDGVLPPAERARRARSAQLAHMARMSLASSRARQRTD